MNLKIMITIMITIFIPIFIGLVIEIISLFLLSRFLWTKRKLVWRIKSQIKTSSLVEENWNENIGTIEDLHTSLFNRYKGINQTIIDFGYENKKLSENVQEFLTTELKPFLSKYRKMILETKKKEDFEISENGTEYLKEYEVIRKKVIDFFIEGGIDA